jgi:hypothetical protein
LSQRRCPVAPPVHDSADRPVSTQCLTHSRSCAQGDVRHEGQPGCPASVPGRLVLPPKVLSQGLMVVHERLRKQHETLLLSLLWHGPSCSALLLLHLPVALCVAQHVPRCHWRAVYYGRSRKPCCCRSNTLVARPETQGLAECVVAVRVDRVLAAILPLRTARRGSDSIYDIGALTNIAYDHDRPGRGASAMTTAKYTFMPGDRNIRTAAVAS